MKKHDESRRAFLIGAAVGAAATTALVPDAMAQTHDQQGAVAVPAEAVAHGHGAGHGAFFNDDDAATIAALSERLMPGTPDKPGAIEAGVLNYIDLALAGAYADQQDFYRRGLAALEAYCRTAHGKPFTQLAAVQQDDVMAALEQGRPGNFTWPTAQAFFTTLRTHTMEGMFADPVYGGNKDFSGCGSLASPARNRCSRMRICKAKTPSRARPSSACKRRPRSGGGEPWQRKRRTSSLSASAPPAASSRPSWPRPG
jgi:gluconate 2-dehydrogenase gamma chain